MAFTHPLKEAGERPADGKAKKEQHPFPRGEAITTQRGQMHRGPHRLLVQLCFADTRLGSKRIADVGVSKIPTTESRIGPQRRYVRYIAFFVTLDRGAQ